MSYAWPSVAFRAGGSWGVGVGVPYFIPIPYFLISKILPSLNLYTFKQVQFYG
jgi:hypothetical protein